MAPKNATAGAVPEGAVVTQGGAQLPAVAPSYTFMQMANPEILDENLGGEKINPFDLDRIKVPAGGSISWEVPTLTGTPDSEKILQGIVVHWKNTRSFWPKSYTGASDPPDCSSADGLTGVGNPGGTCSLCPFSQFGSAPPKDGKPSNAQACKAARLLFLMRPNQLLPTVVSVPPASIAPVKKLFMRLLSQNIPIHSCIMSFGLESTLNKGGIKFSKILPAMVAPLTKEEAAMVEAYTANIQSSLEQVALRKDDVDGDPDTQS